MDAGAELSCSGALETEVTCRSVSCCNESRDSSSLSAPRALTDGSDIPAMPPARRMPSLPQSPARLPRVDPIPALPGGTTQVPVSYVSKAHFGARLRKLLNSSRRTTTKGPHKSDGGVISEAFQIRKCLRESCRRPARVRGSRCTGATGGDGATRNAGTTRDATPHGFLCPRRPAVRRESVPGGT